jgi:hypothetical protein
MARPRTCCGSGQAGRTAIGDREVLLRVHAAGVDRGVWHLVVGLPYAVRLAGYGITCPRAKAYQLRMLTKSP